MILDELKTLFSEKEILYWRDKQKHEVDFVIARRGHPPIAIEAKWKIDKKAHNHFSSFQKLYPFARRMVIATDVDQPYFNRKSQTLETPLNQLTEAITLLDKLPKASG